MDNQPGSVAAPSDASRRGRLALFIFLLPFSLGVVAPIVLMLWEAASRTAIVVSGDAGEFISANSSPGGFTAPSLTSVQTTTGTIVVSGILSAPRGRALTVSRTNKAGMQLCVVGTPVLCASLAGDWPGAVSASPEAASVFDFTKHGLDYTSLGAWLVLGILTTFFAMVAALVVASSRAPDHDSDSPSGCMDGEPN